MKPEAIKGMIFAAGLGTRLYPLTADRPKALVEIQGITLLERAIQKLIAAGIKDIVVNVHHFSEQIVTFLASHQFNARIFISDESKHLLDTAGGLKYAESLLKDADHILLYNVDILSDINLEKMVDFHCKEEALATLAVRDRKTSRYFVFDKTSMQLCGWRHLGTGEETISRPVNNPIMLGFSGIHVVNKTLFNLIPAGEKISLTPLYISWASQHKIVGFDHTQDQWCDVGKYEDVIRMM